MASVHLLRPETQENPLNKKTQKSRRRNTTPSPPHARITKAEWRARIDDVSRLNLSYYVIFMVFLGVNLHTFWLWNVFLAVVAIGFFLEGRG